MLRRQEGAVAPAPAADEAFMPGSETVAIRPAHTSPSIGSLSQIA
jgi:hypothetical protein